MDEKRGSSRLKRHFKAPEDGFWDCTVCTYRNSQEAYKCEICDVRKGTSTRKPRLNAQVVAQQVAQQFPPPLKKERVTPPNSTIKRHRSDDDSYHKNNRTPGMKDIDRNSACHTPVTVGNVTVVITDYKPKLRRESLDTQNLSSDTNDSSSSSGSSTCNELNEDSHAESSN